MIKYTIFNWVPPDLSESERHHPGKAISIVGLKLFTKALKARIAAQAHRPAPFTLRDVVSDASFGNPSPQRPPLAV